MTSDREERIRQLAQRIWESEGRPVGQDVRHWYMAVKLVEASERPDPYAASTDTVAGTDQSAGEDASPPAGPGKKTAKKTAAVPKGGGRKKTGKPDPG